jgi:hypothetical protein
MALSVLVDSFALASADGLRCVVARRHVVSGCQRKGLLLGKLRR